MLANKKVHFLLTTYNKSQYVQHKTSFGISITLFLE